MYVFLDCITSLYVFPLCVSTKFHNLIAFQVCGTANKWRKQTVAERDELCTRIEKGGGLNPVIKRGNGCLRMGHGKINDTENMLVHPSRFTKHRKESFVISHSGTEHVDRVCLSGIYRSSRAMKEV